MSRSDANRNLLFGILALQMDFIGREQLVAATSVWLLDKYKPLEEILVEQEALSEVERQLLVPLVERHIQNHDGDPERSLAALSSIGLVAEDLKSLGDPQLEATLSVVTTPQHDASVNETIAEGTRLVASGAGTSGSSRYRVLRPHARGGLGEVSVAEDTELNREVALKVIQPELADDQSNRSRFVLEAEITGGLEHPGIVPVYGLGQYSDGRPFYAMRFIRGDSLQEAADRFHNPEQAQSDEAASVSYDSVAFRKLLGRFIDVCNAVAYAHSRGVLHRDLKPGNIMLGKYGETLIVDWGLAKLKDRDDDTRIEDESTLQPRSGSGSIPTEMGSAVGTPTFMPPEQAAGKLDELGPASDVYSLGATLYYMLTGRSPVDGDNLAEVLQKVQTGELRPPRAAKHDVPKPLESICMRAMATRPESRYASPQALADDVEHYLADEPVSAHAEPLTVQSRRWMRKHPKSTASLAAALLVGLASAIVIAVVISGKNQELAAANLDLDQANDQLTAKNIELKEANQAERQAKNEAEAKRMEADEARSQEQLAREYAEARREESEAVLAFFQDRVLAAARPEDQDGGLGINATIRAAVDAAEPQIADSFIDQPLVEASIRATLGITYFHLGKAQLAITQHLRSHHLCQTNLGPDHPHTISSMSHLANAYHAAGQFDKAVAMLEETLELSNNNLGPSNSITLSTMNNLAAAYKSAGSLEKAVPIYERVLEIRRDTHETSHPTMFTLMNNLAHAYHTTGRVEDAISIYEPMLESMKDVLGPDHPDTLTVMNNLAEAYRSVSREEDALAILEPTLKLRTEILGPDHPSTLVSMVNLAEAYRTAGRLDKTLSLLEKSLALSREKLGPAHPQTIATMGNLAEAYRAAGQWKKALPMCEEVFRRSTDQLGPDHPDTISALGNLAQAYQSLGRLNEALEIYDDTFKELDTETLGLDPVTKFKFLNNRGNAYRAAGRFDEALTILTTSLREVKEELGADHPVALATMSSLAEAFRSTGRLDEALPLLEETLKLKKKLHGPGHSQTLRAMHNLATCYQNAGRLTEALPILEEATNLMKEQLEPDHRDMLIALQNLAFAYQEAGRLDDALPIYEDTAQRMKDTLGPHHPNTLISMNNLAHAYHKAGRLDKAVPLYEETLTIRKEKLGPHHPSTLLSMNNLASAYTVAGRPDKALPILEEAVELMKEKLGLRHPNTLLSMGNLANAYRRDGRLDEALTLYEDALEHMNETLKPDHPYTLRLMRDLAGAYLLGQQVEKALQMFEQFLATHRRSAKEDDPAFAGLLASVSLDLLKHQQHSAAEPYLRECLDIRRKTMADHWLLFNTQSMLGGALVGQGKALLATDEVAAREKFENAQSLLDAGYEGLKQREDTIPQPARIRITEALRRLVDLYTAWNKPEEAAKWQAKLMEREQQTGAETNPDEKDGSADETQDSAEKTNNGGSDE